MERRLSSWINAVQGQLTPAPIQPTMDSVATSASGIANRNGGRLQRRGGIDLGDGYWDLEKARALREAKTELDSLQLKRLLSGFEL